MKNFTNNFKQFTSRLSARWLVMALMMLVGTSSAWGRNYDGTEKLYFKMNAVSWWNCGTDGNQNFAYFINNSTNKNAWSEHAVKVEDNIYYVLVPKGDWQHVILTRNSVTSSPSFNNKYNQTGDIAIDASKNYITKFSENSTTATWETYTPPCTPPELALAKTSATVNKGEIVNLTTLSGATASNGGTIEWSANSSGSPVIDANVTISETKTYYAKAVKDGCKSAAESIKITAACAKDFYLVGSSATIFGTVWTAAQDPNKMDCNSNSLTKTYTNITVAANTKVEYKITGTSGWGDAEYPSSGNASFTIPTAGTYNIKFTANTNGTSITEPPTVTWELSCNTVAKPTIQLASSPVKCGVDVTAGLITIDGYDDSKYTYTLNKDGNATTIVYNNGYAITEEGSYTVTADVSENSCGAQTSDPQKVTVTDNTHTINSFTVTPASDNVCEGSSVTLAATHVNGATYAWYKGDSATPISGATDYTYSPTITENATFKVVVTKTKNECPATAEATSTIQVIELPAAPTLSPNTDEVCSGKPFTLPGDYNWYEVSTGGTKLNSATISGGITSNKSYWAEAKNASGCVSSTRTEYTLTVNNKPATPTLTPATVSLVYPETATLTAGNTTNGLTYTLYNGETPGESKKSTGSALNFTVSAAGSYTVRVTNDCGTSTSDAVTVTVCTPQTNEFRHANSSYTQLANQPTYYPGDKVYFVSTIDCCLTGTWSNNLQKGEEGWWTGLKGGTPQFYMTLTRAGNFTITNMATNGCTQDKNVLVNLDFTVTALSEVTNANGTVSGANIALTWNHSATHSKVMVVRYPSSGTETIPAGGQAYTEGNTLGGGTVVYVGTAESCTDKNLPAGASYKYYFYTVNNNYYSEGVVLNMSSCPTPAKPQLTSTAVTACDGEVTANGYITITNMADYKNDTYTFKLGNIPANPDANGKITISSAEYTQYTVTVINSCGNSNSADVDIAINDNAPVITGNTSIQPSGYTELTSNKGEETEWEVLDDGGDIGVKKGTTVTFTAKENGTYRVQATYNGCSTIVEIKVQDDLYVWMRKPNKKENAYNNFYYPNENPTQGGMMYYKEFTSKPTTVPECNQGGREADKECTDKEGYTWYGYVISKAAIEANTYYFTVHAANPNGKNGIYTHTLPYKLENVTSDLYFVMDESGSNDGWNINTPVVVRASGDAKFNGNNFADFVPLYVKDANICGKEVVSFEWQKSTTQNGEYTTYNGKSGEGINNIRTREAGWYRCVVTYGDGKGTATSNSIQVTNTTSGTPGTLSFTSKLPILMVNTNGVGFPNEPASGFPSVDAENLKAKVSVDVIIKKGEDIVYDRKARMNYRGSSSLNFQKKSYAFVSGQDSCVFDKSRHDYVKTKEEKMLNLLGDVNYKTSDKDWVLYAATPDPSMMRNRLVFDLYQQMRPGEWGVHSTYVELIVDGVYQGVYVFMDKITASEGRVNITNSDGFIVKFDKTDVADRVERDGDQKTFATTRTGTKNSSGGINSYGTNIDQRFEIEYPEKEDIEDAGGNWEAFYSKVQQRFEDFETALEEKDYTTVRSIIDYDSWADWFILTEFIKNEDGFRASNIFIYNGGKIMATPLWDQELSMDNRTRMAHGSTNPEGLLSTTSSVYSDAFPAPFWFTGGGASITGGLLNDPCFVALVKTKWADYQAGVLSASNCSTLVAKYHGELDDNIRSREATKWPYTQAARGTTNSGKYMGYYNDTEGDPTHYSYNASKNAITTYADGAGGRREGLTTAINGLTGASFSIQIIPSEAKTTPWEPVEIAVSVTPAGYDYKLEYTGDNNLGGVANTIIKEEGDKITYRIPRPSDWGVGDAEEGARADIEYGIKATLSVQEGTTVCGSQAAPSSTGKIILQDEDNDNCK